MLAINHSPCDWTLAENEPPLVLNPRNADKKQEQKHHYTEQPNQGITTVHNHSQPSKSLRSAEQPGVG